MKVPDWMKSCWRYRDANRGNVQLALSLIVFRPSRICDTLALVRQAKGVS